MDREDGGQPGAVVATGRGPRTGRRKEQGIAVEVSRECVQVCGI